MSGYRTNAESFKPMINCFKKKKGTHNRGHSQISLCYKNYGYNIIWYCQSQ